MLSPELFKAGFQLSPEITHYSTALFTRYRIDHCVSLLPQITHFSEWARVTQLQLISHINLDLERFQYLPEIWASLIVPTPAKMLRKPESLRLLTQAAVA